MKQTNFITKILAITFTFCACQNPDNSKETIKDSVSVKRDTSEISGVSDKEKEFKFLSIIAGLPSPAFQVMEIKISNLPVNITYCNSLDNISKYNSNFKKSANYGVYLSDLAYLASFKQNKDVLKYLDATKKLADGLGVKGKFDEIISDRHFQDQLNSPDSLESIIEAIYAATDNFLVSDKHLDMACELFIGSWVENTYLTLSHLKGNKLNEKNKLLVNKMFEQKLHLSKIVSLLEEFKDHKELSPIAQIIKEINHAYSKINDPKVIDADFINLMNIKFNDLRNVIIE